MKGDDNDDSSSNDTIPLNNLVHTSTALYRDAVRLEGSSEASISVKTSRNKEDSHRHILLPSPSLSM